MTIFFDSLSLCIIHLEKNSIKERKLPVHIVGAKTFPSAFLKVPIIVAHIKDTKHTIIKEKFFNILVPIVIVKIVFNNRIIFIHFLF